jgi:hypothetical protein
MEDPTMSPTQAMSIDVIETVVTAYRARLLALADVDGQVVEDEKAADDDLLRNLLSLVESVGEAHDAWERFVGDPYAMFEREARFVSVYRQHPELRGCIETSANLARHIVAELDELIETADGWDDETSGPPADVAALENGHHLGVFANDAA